MARGSLDAGGAVFYNGAAAALNIESTNNAVKLRSGSALIFTQGEATGGTAIQVTGDRGGEVTLTDAVATTVYSATVGDGTTTGGTITSKIAATDGTDHQARVDVIRWVAVRKGATTTVAIDAVDAESVVAASVGTLTTTWTIVDGGAGAITIKVTADTSLTPTSMTAQIRTHSAGNVNVSIP